MKRVSIIVPCRNEADRIGPCLDSILASDYPADLLEILVVDGLSDDGTRDVVADYAARCPAVRLLDNPRRIVPTALNLGIRAAHGEIVVRMDAHVVYPPDYLRLLITALERTGADNVGGRMVTLPGHHGPVARAIAIVLSHPFGVGNSHFRIGTQAPCSVDTVPFGCFRRDVFDRIGLFDEQLIRNQDDEFNHRLLARGGRILLIPNVVSYYYARGRFSQLGRMAYQYGYFKPLVAHKVGRVMTLRQLVPPAFVASLCLLGPLAAIWPQAAQALATLVAGTYALGVTTCAVTSGRPYGARTIATLLMAFPILHASYGAGFLRGVLDVVRGGHRVAGVPLSR